VLVEHCVVLYDALHGEGVRRSGKKKPRPEGRGFVRLCEGAAKAL
jgi:hypothetical protein